MLLKEAELQAEKDSALFDLAEAYKEEAHAHELGDPLRLRKAEEALKDADARLRWIFFEEHGREPERQEVDAR